MNISQLLGILLSLSFSCPVWGDETLESVEKHLIAQGEKNARMTATVEIMSYAQAIKLAPYLYDQYDITVFNLVPQFHYAQVPVYWNGQVEQIESNGRVMYRMELKKAFGGRRAKETGQKEEVIDKDLGFGYTPRKADFALGYLLAGICNDGLQRKEEARDYFVQALRLKSQLKPVIERLESEKYNTVLVVDYGLGPAKIAWGPDFALASYWARMESDNRPLLVSVNGEAPEAIPAACDLNAMSLDHAWNNREDARLARSRLGHFFTQVAKNAFQQGGVGGLAGGLIYGGIALALKASAIADTTYCEIMPQRVYVVPLYIGAKGSKIELQVAGGGLGRPAAKMVLSNIYPPQPPDRIQLRYARMTPLNNPAWQTAEKVLYANDQYDGQVVDEGLPYILGGRCVRKPSEKVLARYQAAGNLIGMTLADLELLYREEAICLDSDAASRQGDVHVLETRRLLDAPVGATRPATKVKPAPRSEVPLNEHGTSMECPLAGTAGFSRLFCQEHDLYVPRSEKVRALSEEIKARRARLADSSQPAVGQAPSR